MGTVLDNEPGCRAPATLELSEIYGSTIVPAGAFCTEHFHLERARLRSEGLRTGAGVVKDAEQRCCWVAP